MLSVWVLVKMVIRIVKFLDYYDILFNLWERRNNNLRVSTEHYFLHHHNNNYNIILSLFIHEQKSQTYQHQINQ
jgi:hypothetical protein